MKRYKCNFFLPLDDNGEWVKWESVKQAVESYNAWVERGIWKEDGCNCAEKARDKRNPSGAWWICSAHGYKRL